MNALKRYLRAVTPYGLVELRREQLAQRAHEAADVEKAAFHADRRQRIAAVTVSKGAAEIEGDCGEQVITFLRGRGLSEAHLLEGSVPQSSLEYVRENVIVPTVPTRPLIALHIGNFVGVSLAFLAAAVKERHPDSLVVSIDPNLTHRGISNPQAHVSALLAACGLQRNTMIIAGYSGQKSISNDGVVFDEYDPRIEFLKESACEESLRNLSILCRHTFDLVLMDGNHEASYLVNEIQTALKLLKLGGFVILDDVDTAWAEIQDVFSHITSFGLDPIGTDGRVGIARLSRIS